jgi:hypothetical protein
VLTGKTICRGVVENRFILRLRHGISDKSKMSEKYSEFLDKTQSKERPRVNREGRIHKNGGGGRVCNFAVLLYKAAQGVKNIYKKTYYPHTLCLGCTVFVNNVRAAQL